MEHVYRHNTLSFYGVYEQGIAPHRMTIEEIYRATTTQTTWLANGG